MESLKYIFTNLSMVFRLNVKLSKFEFSCSDPYQFYRIGEFPGTYYIILNEEAQPVIHAPKTVLDPPRRQTGKRADQDREGRSDPQGRRTYRLGKQPGHVPEIKRTAEDLFRPKRP